MRSAKFSNSVLQIRRQTIIYAHMQAVGMVNDHMGELLSAKAVARLE